MSDDGSPSNGLNWPVLWWTLGGIVAVAGIVLAVVLVINGAGAEQNRADAGPGTSSSATPPPQPAATAPSELPALQPVAPDSPAPTTDGIGVAIVKMEAITGDAVLPGEVSGPVVRYSIEISNDSSDPLDLTFASVTAYLGESMAPALQLTQPGGSPFAGVLQPGEKATGVYLFRVPLDQRQNVTLNVLYEVGSPAAVFQGAVPTE